MKVNSNIKSGFNFGISISNLKSKLEADRFAFSAKSEWRARHKQECFKVSNFNPLNFNKF